MGELKITDIKMDWSNIQLHDPDDKSLGDGANGYLVEDILERAGLPIDREDTTDLPGMEVKTMTEKPKSPHTIGRMTYNKIVKTPWSKSPVKKKMDRQYQVVIAKSPVTGQGRVKEDRVVNYNHPSVQRELESAYEDCRRQLAAIGPNNHATVKSGPAIFEYRPNKSGGGNGYQFRLSVKGMRNLTGAARAAANDLFDFE